MGIDVALAENLIPLVRCIHDDISIVSSRLATPRPVILPVDRSPRKLTESMTR